MTTVVVVPSSGSVPLSAGTATRVEPPGLGWGGALTVVAAGRRSMPKFALATLTLVTDSARMPLTVPSLPVPVPTNSPVLAQPDGSAAAGAALPTVPAVVLSTTV